MMIPVMQMNNDFGKIIHDLREDGDLSQTELGSAVGMSQRKISYLETGKCEPSLADIRQFAVFFNLSADYLLGLCDQPKQLHETKIKPTGR